MRMPFFASLAFAALFAVVGFGVSRVAADGSMPDSATWRWTVSAALDAQNARDSAGGPSSAVASADYRQRHERYSVTGQPEAVR